MFSATLRHFQASAYCRHLQRQENNPVCSISAIPMETSKQISDSTVAVKSNQQKDTTGCFHDWESPKQNLRWWHSLFYSVVCEMWYKNTQCYFYKLDFSMTDGYNNKWWVPALEYSRSVRELEPQGRQHLTEPHGVLHRWTIHHTLMWLVLKYLSSRGGGTQAFATSHLTEGCLR